MDSDWLFANGGVKALGFCSGTVPDPVRIEAASRLLGRPRRLVDQEGYQCEIFAAAIDEESGGVAYVESRAKKLEFVDVSVLLHIRGHDGGHIAWELKTYNPYFGCSVRYLEWHGDTVFLIYHEKHATYVCRMGMESPAVCKRIGDYWILNSSTLTSRTDKNATEVHCLSFPELEEQPDLSRQQAESAGLFPHAASLLPTEFQQRLAEPGSEPLNQVVNDMATARFAHADKGEGPLSRFRKVGMFYIYFDLLLKLGALLIATIVIVVTLYVALATKDVLLLCELIPTIAIVGGVFLFIRWVMTDARKASQRPHEVDGEFLMEDRDWRDEPDEG